MYEPFVVVLDHTV